jgi:membrane-bound metal-dependent hydrolase YbcI (DUF457 family)
MFIGHFAVALAAKRAAPEVSLGTLFLAAQLADLVWPTLVLFGLESFTIRPGLTAVTPLDFTHYPYSHSLVALVGWGLALAGLHFSSRHRLVAALVLFLVVLSHWVLDVAAHRPDMPVTIGGSARLGFGLWNSIPATVAVEGLLFAACVWAYARATRALDWVGRWSLVVCVVFLAVIYAANVFGPPPPSVAAVAWSAQAIWLLVAWGYWIDRHRAASRN